MDSSGELRTDITGLISQAAATNTQIADSAATVPDNSEQFDVLLHTATSTSGGAEHVLGGLNALAGTSSAGLEENRGYYANFATVLANTRTQGVDASSIYDFFAAPVAAMNITSEGVFAASVPAPTSWLDLKWVAVFNGGMLAGILIPLAARIFRKKRTTSRA